MAQLLARQLSVASSQKLVGDEQGSAPIEQTPVWQVSAPLQNSPSVQDVPFGSKPSGGQLLPRPSQFSATSHAPISGRHCAVLLASAGQASLMPSQLSGRSQTPAERRQTAVLFASAGQSKLTPSQWSATSQTSTPGRHTVLVVAGASAGQLPAPSQNSAASHASPALAARHCTDVGSLLGSQAPARQLSGFEQSVSLRLPHGVPSGVVMSGGQLTVTPSQISCASHSP